MNLIFHIGAHKSATTSLQSYLNNKCKKSTSIKYIGPLDNNPAITSLVRLSRNGGSIDDIDLIVDKFNDEVNKYNTCSSIIFSDENILGAMPGLKKEFYPGAKLVANVLEILSKNHNVKVVLQVRQQAALLYSCYGYRLTRGDVCSTFETFSKNIDVIGMSWKYLYDIFSQKLDVTILPIELLKTEKGVELYRDLVSRVLPDLDLIDFKMPHENSFSKLSIILAKYINLYSPDSYNFDLLRNLDRVVKRHNLNKTVISNAKTRKANKLYDKIYNAVEHVLPYEIVIVAVSEWAETLSSVHPRGLHSLIDSYFESSNVLMFEDFEQKKGVCVNVW